MLRAIECEFISVDFFAQTSRLFCRMCRYTKLNCFPALIFCWLQADSSSLAELCACMHVSMCFCAQIIYLIALLCQNFLFLCKICTCVYLCVCLCVHTPSVFLCKQKAIINEQGDPYLFITHVNTLTETHLRPLTLSLPQFTHVTHTFCMCVCLRKTCFYLSKRT